MITCTSLPDVIRVQFVLSDQPTNQVDIVCYVRACDTGLEINYSHHVSRTRQVPSGGWEKETPFRTGLTVANMAAIHFNVWQELQNVFGTRVRTLPADFGAPIEKVRF
jgi:hypothetical protein